MGLLQTLRVAGIALASVGGAIARRGQRRAALPQRSARADLACAALRGVVMASQRHGVHWLREVQDAAPQRSDFLNAVEREAVDAGGVPAVWFRPTGRTPERTLVYFHGGGYVIGSVDGYVDLLARAAIALDAQVLGVDYRLAPEHPLPAAQQDCLQATRWVRDQGVADERLLLGGDSAGGALAVATLCELRDAGEALPAAALLFCPWTDPFASGGSMNAEFDFGTRDLLVGWIRTALAGGDAADPRYSVVNAKLEGLPPLHIQAGGAELLHDQVCAFAEAARASGVEVDLRVYPDMFHIFQVQAALVPEGAAALDHAFAFARAQAPTD